MKSRYPYDAVADILFLRLYIHDSLNRPKRGKRNTTASVTYVTGINRLNLEEAFV